MNFNLPKNCSEQNSRLCDTPRSAPPSTSRAARIRRYRQRQLNNASSVRLTQSAPLFRNPLEDTNTSKNQEESAVIVTLKTGPDAPQFDSTYSSLCSYSYLEQVFQVENVLGAGSFGLVQRVRRRRDGALFALKSINRRDNTCTPSFLMMARYRLQEEICHHEAVPPHPNIIEFYMGWKEKGEFHLLLELADGCSLKELVSGSPKPKIPDSRIWSYYIDILLALRHLHAVNLIHGDVKPANLIVNRNNVCKLADFGLLSYCTKDKYHDRNWDEEGDGLYLAPEAYFEQPMPRTTAADMFSTGITLLEMCTSLIVPSWRSEMWENGVWRRPEFLDGISMELRSEILPMLSVMPDFRPTSAELLMRHEMQARMNSMQQVTYGLTLPTTCCLSHFVREKNK